MTNHLSDIATHIQTYWMQSLTIHVKIGGNLIAMKGASGMIELEDAKNAISTLGGKFVAEHHIFLTDENGNKDERYIFVIQKVKHTPNNFPRQYAQILKKPL